MPTLVELATQIVTAQTTASALSTDDILTSLTRVHAILGQLESNALVAVAREGTEPALKLEKAFRKNEVVCMLCGKSYKMLGTHLTCTHGITPNAYRKQFAIPKSQPLAAKSYTESLKRRSLESLALMAKGREARRQKTAESGEPLPVKAAPVAERSAQKPVEAPPAAQGQKAAQAQQTVQGQKAVQGRKAAQAQQVGKSGRSGKAVKAAKAQRAPQEAAPQAARKVGRPRKERPTDAV